MNWFIVGVVILFFTVAILTSDYWLDKLMGAKPIHTWDETEQLPLLEQALAPYEDRRSETERPTHYDFRPEHKRGPHEH